MKLLNILGGFALAATAVLGEEQGRAQAWNFKNELTTGPVEAQFTITKDTLGKSLDIPRVSPRPNATSFDWWYFDAVNPANLNESVVVIFYLTTNDSFPLRLTPDNSVSVDVFLTFADGSSTPLLIDSAKPNTEDADDFAATITYDGNELVMGNWTSTGVSFGGIAKNFHVDVKVPSRGVFGSIDIVGDAPGHYPCSLKGKEGETLEALSHIGWTNSLPGGDATVYFTSGTKKLQFNNGLGYHDKKWSDRPYQASVKDWYWGHADLGPYTLVWLNSNSHDGKTYQNGYLSHKSGETHVACANNLGGAEPKIIDIQIFDECYEMTFELPDAECLKVRVEKTKVIGERGPFKRWTGKTSATLKDGTQVSGTALFQEFHF